MWDVLYAIDASTSMGGEAKPRTGPPYVKMEAVKEGITQVVKALPFPYEARVGVIGFSAPTKALGMMVDSKQDIVQEAQVLTPVSKLRGDLAGLTEALNKIRVGGATPTGEAMQRAADLLRQDSGERRPRIKKMVVVTDEKSNVGPRPAEILDADLVKRAMVDVVAIGGPADRKSFERIASRTGGKFAQVNTAPELSVALNPGIPYSDPLPPNPLLSEAERVAEVLKGTDKNSASYQGMVSAGAAVRERLMAKLQETISVEGQARGDADLVVSAAMGDPKYPTMSMREYADRVWSRCAELSRLQILEEAYRAAIASLSE